MTKDEKGEPLVEQIRLDLYKDGSYKVVYVDLFGKAAETAVGSFIWTKTI